MSRVKIVPGEHYHIYNRENNKQKLFLEERDWVRFLFLVLYFQSPVTTFLNNLSRPVSYFVEHRMFNIQEDEMKKILKDRYVELVGFVLMPNHFHLIIRELQEGGISKYMQRVQNAYTKYFNTKYKKSGHLFQGPFQVVHIKNNEQLLHLSAYVHRNPREIKKWKGKEHNYPWSSFQDYVKENRWGNLLKHQLVTKQFPTSKKYSQFVKTSGTKLNFDEKHRFM